MLILPNRTAALLMSAALFVSSLCAAQAPIVDASVDRYARDQRDSQPVNGPVDSVAMPAGSDASQGELLYQLQLLQQEVMQLRGAVEQQAYQLKRMKEQNMERYIDLDRRLGELATRAPAPTTGADTNAQAQPSGSASSVTAKAGEKSRYSAAYNLVLRKQFDEALTAFKQFLVEYPDGKYAPNSLYWLGELYQVVSPQDLEASRQNFAQLLDQYPNHAKAADAMYKLGKVYYQKGNLEKSRQWLERVIAEYGSGVNSAADKARQFLKTKF